jgi:drug/metabolite transporter (DMT)-like permease
LLLPWIALVAVWFLWGSTYIGIRYAVKTIPPLLMSGSRYFSAGVILMVVLVLKERGWPRMTLRQTVCTAIAGAAMLLGGNGLLSLGEQHLQSGVAALLVATVPLTMIVESAVIRRTGIAGRSIIAIILGSAGVVILIGAPGSTIDYAAAASVFIGAFFWATGSVFLTTADMPRNPVLATAMEMIFGGILLIIAGTATGEIGSLHFATISTASTLGWLWLIGPGAILGFSAYTFALNTLPTSTVATYAYVNPVVAVSLGAMLGDQLLTGGLLFGGAAVIGAVVVTLSKRRVREVDAIPIEPMAEIA